ncbi:hypothetical protein O5Y_21165 [Rhodococcus erythropolis CCM2595]|nr:hypothetical protein O5Y_21165 [Rhodococcus erythropolis CCM2595]
MQSLCDADLIRPTFVNTTTEGRRAMSRKHGKHKPRPLMRNADGELLSRFAGRCWYCGDPFGAGTPIRFIQRETLHVDCHKAATLDQ